MITQKEVRRKFKQCELTLNYCWEVLADMKALNVKDNSIGERMLNFQDRLATNLFDLQGFKNQISQEKIQLVKAKNLYPTEIFVRKIKMLSGFSKCFEFLINISKNLGDVFVWFFYRNDLDLIDKHSTHTPIKGFVSGAGGKGELSFLKNVKHIAGCFTLYHGISTVLRYGDYSFIDLETFKVIGTGELKSRLTDDGLINCSLSLINLKGSKLDSFAKEIQIGKSEQPKWIEDKLRKQIPGIVNLFRDKNEGDFNKKIHSEFYFSDLEKLHRQTKVGHYSLKKLSDGLGLTGIKVRRKSLFSKISNFKIPEFEEDEIVKFTMDLLKPNSSENGVIMGNLLFDLNYESSPTWGMLPLFWQPINISILKDIYFMNFLVMTTFNPIHLIDKIREMGFLVESRYVKNNPKGRHFQHRLTNFDFFAYHILNNLQKEDFVLKTLSESINIAKEKNKPMNIRIIPQQSFEF